MNYPSNSDAIKKSTNLKHNNEAQFFVNELVHHYNLRCPKGVKPTMVFFVVRINGEQVRISTGLKVYPKYWDKEKAMENKYIPFIDNNNNKLLNERLSLYSDRFTEYKMLANEGKVSINKNTLKHYINTGEIIMEETKVRLDIAKQLSSYLRKDESIKEGTKNNYFRFIDKFGEFLRDKELYSYEEITQPLMKGFQEWCVNNVQGRKKGERANSASINKIVECTYKMIKKYFVNGGIMKGSQFADIQIEPLKEVFIDDEIALRDDELTMLYNYACKKDTDEQIKDLFLLECTTGQRFSDIDKVNKLIEHKDKRTYINLVQEKTGEKIQVDIIFQMALEILAKYNYSLPTFDRSKFNKRIKVIAKEAGIKGTEEQRKEEAGKAGINVEQKARYNCVSSHTGRRTFVTLLSLRGYNENEISRYTGHSTLNMVHLYDKSNKGSKEKTMFEQLKKERPELILRMANEPVESKPVACKPIVNEPVESKPVAREIIREIPVIYNLTQGERIIEYEIDRDIDISQYDLSKNELEFLERTNDRFGVGVPTLKIKKIIDKLAKLGIVVRLSE